jgi:hypothetical protein
MTSFLTFMATPAINQVIETNSYGRKCVRLGRLYSVVVFWVYQQGGLLGYLFRDSPSLLVKLLSPSNTIVESEQALREIDFIGKELYTEREELQDDEKGFFGHSVRELRKMGVELIKIPPDEGLDVEVKLEDAGVLMRKEFVHGIAFGFHFPGIFTSYWESAYKIRDEKEWVAYWKRGIVSSKQQKIQAMSEAICGLCNGAMEWNSREIPQILDSIDMQVLEDIRSEHLNG